MKHVTIIGGGIAGLATAYYFQRKAHELGVPAQYTLIEKDDRLGGKIVTERVDDFIIEGGPDSFITLKPWGLQLCNDLGIRNDLIPCNQDDQQVSILHKGRLCPLPTGFRMASTTNLKAFLKTPLISPLGKLRLLSERWRKPRMSEEDESISDFLLRRVGNEALHNLSGPLMAGIYAGDPDRLSIQCTFPQFADMERTYGSLTKGITARTPKSGKSPPMFMALKGGMGDLVTVIENQLEGTILKNTRIESITPKEHGYKIAVETNGEPDIVVTGQIVMAVSSEVVADLVQSFNPELATALSAIRSVSTTTVSLAYDHNPMGNEPYHRGYGFIAPRKENSALMACTWSSIKFPGRAPDRGFLFRAFVGGDGSEAYAEMPDDELLALVRKELSQIAQIQSAPCLHRIYRWPKGNPQYDVGHMARIDDLEQKAKRHPGLHFTGSAFRGIGIPDCVHSALETVDRIFETPAD